jgi:dolichol-phosphate mannosyltransferase
MQVSVVLPVFNEEKALTPLLERFVALSHQVPWRLGIVIVDDGSTDRSVQVAESFRNSLPLEVFQHTANRGLGAAIRNGLTLAASKSGPDDVIVTMDADNTHPPELIVDMMERIAAGSDVVIASRYRKSAKVVGLSGFRRMMSHGARLVFQIIAPIPNVRDYTCGFRAYRASVLRRVLDQFGDELPGERGFACGVEILLKLGALGAKMCEVPFVLRYDLKGTPSKMNVGESVRRHLVLAWRHRFPARLQAPQKSPKQPPSQADCARPPE